MVVICPTVTAFDLQTYREQLLQIKPFARRVHLDLMDGDFAPSLSPGLDDIWWPHEMVADIHLMYRRPMDYLPQLIQLRPNMVVVHAEAEVHHMHFAAELHKAGIKAGLCVLQDTPIRNVTQIMHSFDHVLVFSGHLGYHGGHADMGILTKIDEIRANDADIEIGWDGGINDQNAAALVAGGVSVLNVGGYIQKSPDPDVAYRTLEQIVHGGLSGVSA